MAIGADAANTAAASELDKSAAREAGAPAGNQEPQVEADYDLQILINCQLAAKHASAAAAAALQKYLTRQQGAGAPSSQGKKQRPMFMADKLREESATSERK